MCVCAAKVGCFALGGLLGKRVSGLSSINRISARSEE